jgi:hypothetical protein
VQQTNTNRVTLLNSAGCGFSQFICPSKYAYCSYEFVRYGKDLPNVACDMFNTQSNPGTLQPGQSLCPAYDYNRGYSNIINCQFYGFLPSGS